MAQKITRTFGGNGGGNFADQFPDKLGLRAGNRVDALVLNGVRYGGSGGSNPQEIDLGANDYWCEFQLRSGEAIDYLRFKATNGSEILGGGGGGSNHGPYTGVRILRIGGRCGESLDSIRIEYIEGYQPSTRVEEAWGILSLLTANTSISIAQDYASDTVLSYSHSTTVFSGTETSTDVSVSGEYYAQYSASTGITTTNSTTESISESCEKHISQSTSLKMDYSVGTGQTGFLVAKIQIMRAANGNRYWMYPLTASNWETVDQANYGRLIGYYDFTGGVPLATGLATRDVYGFDQLTAAS